MTGGETIIRTMTARVGAYDKSHGLHLVMFTTFYLHHLLDYLQVEIRP